MIFDLKLTQIQLQHRIIEMMHKDNGVTCHFDYHVNMMNDTNTIKLNLLTFNERHNHYMLFNSTSGKSSIDCLKKMIAYLEDYYGSVTKYSFTIKWNKKGETGQYVSYFRAKDDAEALLKFKHEKNIDDYDYEIVKNPIA